MYDSPEFEEVVLEGKRYSRDVTGACESEIFDEKLGRFRKMTDAEHVEAFAAYLRCHKVKSHD